MDTNQLVDQRDFLVAFLNWRDSETSEDAQEAMQNYDFLMRGVSNYEFNSYIAALNLHIARERLGKAMLEMIEAIQFAKSV